MVPPLTLCAYMKKGPNLRWSLIQCSTPPCEEVLYGNSDGDARTIFEKLFATSRWPNGKAAACARGELYGQDDGQRVSTGSKPNADQKNGR
ncbi:MAG: hypothetical protein BHV61_00995 [Collinsella sp. 60_9]|nr:MAG: hypothetical protein BHV61_00995 [Collinsella sp. 60_9]